MLLLISGKRKAEVKNLGTKLRAAGMTQQGITPTSFVPPSKLSFVDLVDTFSGCHRGLRGRSEKLSPATGTEMSREEEGSSLRFFFPSPPSQQNEPYVKSLISRTGYTILDFKLGEKGESHPEIVRKSEKPFSRLAVGFRLPSLLYKH